MVVRLPLLTPQPLSSPPPPLTAALAAAYSVSLSTDQTSCSLAAAAAASTVASVDAEPLGRRECNTDFRRLLAVDSLEEMAEDEL